MSPFKITVVASSDHPDSLDVRDAMQQVRDYFDLMTDDGCEAAVFWKLTSVSMQSPLTVIGEPIDMRTNAGAYGLIREHVNRVRQGLEHLRAGEDFGPDFPQEKRDTAIGLLRRNLNGIGSTHMSFGDDTEGLEIDRQTAVRSLNIIDNRDEELYEYLFGSFARREIGSIDGLILDVGTDNDEPAIHVEDSLTHRRISCRVSEEDRRAIQHNLTAADVWERRRVRIQGQLNYDATGRLIRLYEGKIRFLEIKDVSLDHLHDPDFTGGLSPQEYLDRLWEGELE